MRKRNIRSIKHELVKKAREALLAAVQIYNNPNITFKTESFITLSIIGWTYLLHAYYHSLKKDYHYYSQKKINGRKKYDTTKNNAKKTWSLEDCINKEFCPLDKDSINNLRFIIGIRHEIEHQMTNKIDEYVSAKLQACAINFDYYITKLFGEKYSLSKYLSLNIQFSPISEEQKSILSDNSYLTSNVRNFITSFENSLSDEDKKSSRYAYRVLLTPISVNSPNKADKTITFIPANSSVAKDIQNTYVVLKETEKKKYLPNEIITEMKKLGFVKFNMHNHTELWKSMDAKNPKYNFGTKVAKTWYWYQNWFEEVKKHCEGKIEKYR